MMFTSFLKEFSLRVNLTSCLTFGDVYIRCLPMLLGSICYIRLGHFITQFRRFIKIYKFLFGCLPIEDFKIVVVDIEDNETNEISSSVNQVI